MRIVAGLGNPGSRYAGNRHNIGLMALSALARRWNFGPWRDKFHGRVADGVIGDEKIVVLAPATYMNESGQAIAAAMRFYKLAPGDVIVIHDELELAPGKMRVKTGGGAAGHNGLKSIDAHIGPDYHRVRLGIGHPGVKHLVHDYVLQDFPKADEPWVEKLVAAVADAMPALVAGDANGFMNKVTLAIHPPPPRRAPETAAPEK